MQTQLIPITNEYGDTYFGIEIRGSAGDDTDPWRPLADENGPLLFESEADAQELDNAAIHELQTKYL